MRIMHYILLGSCAAAALCGCGNGNPESTSNTALPEQSAEISLNGAVLLDVRSPDEYASGHLQGALNIPHDQIAEKIGAAVPDKSTRVILYCRSGRRADTALKTLKAVGYESVLNFGGLEDARERLALPVEKE